MVCGALRTRNQFVTKNNMKAGKNDQSLTGERRGRLCLLFLYELLKPHITCGLHESASLSTFSQVSFIFSQQRYDNWNCTHHGVGMSSPLQVMAALGVGVGADTQTVGGVELLHEERTAGLNHRWQLEQAGGRQQRLNGVLPQLETTWREEEEKEWQYLKVSKIFSHNWDQNESTESVYKTWWLLTSEFFSLFLFFKSKTNPTRSEFHLFRIFHCLQCRRNYKNVLHMQPQ